MRVALVNPDMYPIWDVIVTDSLRKPEYRPPIGLLCIAATLREAGHEVRLWDNYVDEAPTASLVSDVAAWEPDAVGISCLTTSFPEGRDIAAALRQHLPGTFIGIGGHHPTLMPERTLDETDGIDALFMGEGEHTFPEALRLWEAGERIDSIPGVVVPGGLVTHPKPIPDLDVLPMPDRSLIDWRRYDMRGSTLEVEPVFVVTSSRGCAYRCAFCGMADWNKRYRTRSAGIVVDEIEQLVERHGAKGVYFREDNFTLDRRHVVAFCDEMIARGVPALWECESRVDSLDRATLERMHEAGCRGVWCGVESGSQRVLDSIRKGTKVADAHRFYRECEEIGIATGALFMIGLPGETEEEVWQTYEHAVELSPSSWLGFQAYVAIPKCDLYDRVVAEGLWVREWNGIYEVETAELSRARIAELETELNRRYATDPRRRQRRGAQQPRHRKTAGAIPDYASAE